MKFIRRLWQASLDLIEDVRFARAGCLPRQLVPIGKNRWRCNGCGRIWTYPQSGWPDDSGKPEKH